MTLHDELLNDPNSLGYAPHIASGNDGAIFNLINAKTISANGFVTVNRLISWLAKTSMRGKVKAFSEDSTSPLHNSSLGVLDVIQGNAEPRGLDLSDADNLIMLNAWVSVGVITQAQESDLITLSQKLISRADQLGYDCSISAIATELRG